MPDNKPVKLPQNLIPSDGRFGSGPSRIRPEQLATLAAAGATLLGTSHRQQPVKSMVHSIRTGLLDLFQAPPGYEIILGLGGASAFWDAASFCLIEHRSQNLVAGEFGGKFAKAAGAPWLERPDIRQAPAGSRPEPSAVAGIDLYAWAHNETSTGVKSPIKRVAGADPDALVVVDGTSAAGGIKFDPQELDVYYFSPQKNLGSDGGLWLALVSPKAIERIKKIAATDRYIPDFLSLNLALENSLLDQTLNTPAIATLIMLADQIEWINANGGLTWADARTTESSSLLYSWAERDLRVTPFVTIPADRSNVVVTIDFADGIEAAQVAKTLRSNGIVDVDPYRKLGRNQLRIGTFVSVDPADVATLIAAIEYILDAD